VTEKNVVCKMCSGKGTIVGFVTICLTPKSEITESRTVFCPQCRGTGEVDWIDEILDRNKRRLE